MKIQSQTSLSGAIEGRYGIPMKGTSEGIFIYIKSKFYLNIL